MTRSGRDSTLNLTGSAGLGNADASRASPGGDVAAARAIHTAYERWIRGFEEVTRRARGRFERRDWRGAQADASARLALYRIHLDGAVADVGDILEDAVLERTRWAAVKTRHQEGLAGRPDAELARTFFNSVTRRIFSTVGADPAIEYLDPAPDTGGGDDDTLIVSHTAAEVNGALLREVLDAYPWSVGYAQPDRDAEDAAAILRERLTDSGGEEGPFTVEMLRSVF